MKKTIQIWGETQVGKTTLLSAALFSRPLDLPQIDRQRSSDILSNLEHHWQLLKNNQLAPGTPTEIETELHLKPNPAGLESIILRDMKGGDVRALSQTRIQDLLHSADGILVLLAWDDQDFERQKNALESVLVHYQHKPIFLCLTKAEQALHPTRDKAAWNAEPGWWKRYRPWMYHQALFELLDQSAICPSSAYGYDAFHPTRPACLLGEYGNWIPYHIQPMNVTQALSWFIESWTQDAD